jgi:sortase (surface protein transpeptidase)
VTFIRPRLELSPRAAAVLGGLWVIMLIVGVILLLAGCGTAPAPAGGYLTPVVPAVAPTIAPAKPAAVSIPRLGVTSTLIETGVLPDGTAETPPVEHPEQASWLRTSPAPGDPGPAVLYGHVDGHVDGHGRAGVFHDLGKLRDGDQIVVGRAGAPDVTFAVYEVREVAKAAFPTDLVYGNTPGAELRLVTCSGVFDHAAGHYVDNTVVLARLVVEPQPPVGPGVPPTT